MNTPFVCVPIPGERPVGISGILRLIWFESHLLCGGDDLDLAENPIGWVSVNQVVVSERRNSTRLLEKAIVGSSESLKNE